MMIFLQQVDGSTTVRNIMSSQLSFKWNDGLFFFGTIYYLKVMY